MINDKGSRTLRVKHHDRLQALTPLAKISGMLITQQEISGPGGGPIGVDHTIDHSARTRTRLDAIAARLRRTNGATDHRRSLRSNRVRGNRLIISV